MEDSSISTSLDTESVLSKRGIEISKFSSVLEIGFYRCAANPYNKDTNPQGAINAGTAENCISNDIVADKLSTIQSPFVDNPDILKYHDFTGMKSFRETLAEFLTLHTNASVPLDANKLIIMNGLSSVVCALATVLSDAGDAWLMPTPYYSGIRQDVSRIAQINIVYVHLPGPSGCLSEAEYEPFQLTVDLLETSFTKAKTQGHNVRCLFLINPHNPLGDVYSKETVLQCLHFAKRNNLHVIMDEVYMLSIFQEDVKFTSVFSLDTLPDPQRTHVIWGFSKDFCMSGLRCGALYTWNDRVLIALKQISIFFCVPTSVQYYLNEMIKDKDWVEKTYIPTNLQRLRESHRNMSDGLTKIGVPHLVRPSGLYIWADFRKYITPVTVESELQLFNEILDNNVYLTPGEEFSCCQPGWFRIIFAIDKDKQEVVLKRISEVLKRRLSSLKSE